MAAGEPWPDVLRSFLSQHATYLGVQISGSPDSHVANDVVCDLERVFLAAGASYSPDNAARFSALLCPFATEDA